MIVNWQQFEKLVSSTTREWLSSADCYVHARGQLVPTGFVAMPVATLPVEAKMFVEIAVALFVGLYGDLHLVVFGFTHQVDCVTLSFVAAAVVSFRHSVFWLTLMLVPLRCLRTLIYALDVGIHQQ